MKSVITLVLALCPILFSMECFSQSKGALATPSDAGTEPGAYHLDTFSKRSAVEHAKKLEERLLRQEELNNLGHKPDVRNLFILNIKVHQDGFEKSGPLKPLSGPIPEIRITEGMMAMQKVKPKYTKTLDSRKPEREIKRNSLRGHSFFQRWETIIDGSIFSLDPLQTLLLPALGYRLEKQWTVGAGPTIITKFGKRGSQDKIQNLLSWEGYWAYSKFRISHHVFIQAEYQRENLSITRDIRAKKLDVFSGGIGNEFKLAGDFKIRSTVLYRINEKERSKTGLNSPWRVRIGIAHFTK